MVDAVLIMEDADHYLEIGDTLDTVDLTLEAVGLEDRVREFLWYKPQKESNRRGPHYKRLVVNKSNLAYN